MAFLFKPRKEQKGSGWLQIDVRKPFFTNADTLSHLLFSVNIDIVDTHITNLGIRFRLAHACPPCAGCAVAGVGAGLGCPWGGCDAGTAGASTACCACNFASLIASSASLSANSSSGSYPISRCSVVALTPSCFMASAYLSLAKS